MRDHGIYHKPNLRKTVEGMLYRMRVGCPWRDLPKEFGCWNTVFQKFNRWSSRGKLMSIFRSLVKDPDLEWEFIDGSIVKAHQHSAGVASEENQEPLENPVEAIQQKFIWLLMHMDYPLILR